MKKRDLFWLLAYPLYQVIGTIRHEAGHALMAMAQGAEITEFMFIPGFWEERFYFGYVSWEGGDPTWLTTAAPYFLDLLTFAIFFVLCYWGRFKRHWLWLNLVILGVISPLLNTGYQYVKVGLAGGGDIGWLLEHRSSVQVHGYMIVTILLYLAGMIVLMTRSRHIRDQRAGANIISAARQEEPDLQRG